MTFYSLFLLLYSIFRFIAEEKGGIKDFSILAGKMILLGITVLLMNFMQLFISFQKMFFSPRVSGNASYSSILASGQEISENSSIVGTTILRFFSSDILGTGSNFQGWSNYLEAPLFYISLLTLLIFPQVFIYLDKRKKIVFGSFLNFWILTLLIPIWDVSVRWFVTTGGLSLSIWVTESWRSFRNPPMMGCRPELKN